MQLTHKVFCDSNTLVHNHLLNMKFLMFLYFHQHAIDFCSLMSLFFLPVIVLFSDLSHKMHECTIPQCGNCSETETTRLSVPIISCSGLLFDMRIFVNTFC